MPSSGFCMTSAWPKEADSSSGLLGSTNLIMIFKNTLKVCAELITAFKKIAATGKLPSIYCEVSVKV